MRNIIECRISIRANFMVGRFVKVRKSAAFGVCILSRNESDIEGVDHFSMNFDAIGTFSLKIDAILIKLAHIS